MTKTVMYSLKDAVLPLCEHDGRIYGGKAADGSVVWPCEICGKGASPQPPLVPTANITGGIMTDELELWLHLGCGKRKLPGWVGVDSRNDVGADLVCDIRHLDHYASGEVAAIYACHVLEHIPRPEVLSTLREWRRVLKPGGVLYVAVPDFNTLALLHTNNGIPLWRLIGPLCGRQDYPANTHYSVYDYQYLAWTLTEAGFHSIAQLMPSEWSEWQPEGYDDYSRAKIDGWSISLNVEAIRGDV